MSESRSREDLELQIVELRTALENEKNRQRADFESLQGQIRVTKEVETLKRQLSRFQTVAVVLSILAAFVGFYGVKSITDLRDTAERNLKETVEKTSAYYSDLLTAYAYVNTKNFRGAIPLLQSCFDERMREGKHYDPSVLAPLLMSYNEIDDWEDAERVIQVLEKDPGKLNDLKDSWLFNNIGSIRAQEALDDPNKLPSGMYWLGLARQITPVEDEEMAQDVFISLWMAALAKKDLKDARQYLSQITADDPRVREPESWQEVIQWRFTKALFRKYPELQEPVRAMWNEERERIRRKRAAPMTGRSVARGN